MNSQSFALLVSIELIMAISIVLSLVRNIKKISILNLEGNNSFAIIFKLVATDLLIIFAILPIIVIIGYCIIFSLQKNTVVHLELVRIIMKYFLYLKTVDLLFIMIYIVTVSRITVNEGIKGKSNVNLLSSTLYFSKIILIILSMSPIISSVSYINDFYYGEEHYNNAKENMKNMYKVSGMYAGDAQNLEDHEDVLKEIVKSIKNERKAFDISV